MHNPASVLENDTHKLLQELDIRTDPPNLGQKTVPNNNQQKKRTCKIVDFVVPAYHRIKLKECEKKDKYFDLARELIKLWNMKVAIIQIKIGAFGTVTIGLLKILEDLEVGGLGSWRTRRGHPNYSIIKNGQNTEKCHGDLKRLSATQTRGKDHQLIVMRISLISK